ncbi:MAG: hypothetical protein JNM14_12705 [Ferruginibacter sp.]|nr:hypothetical protein [Ferruginibacter sp.]
MKNKLLTSSIKAGFEKIDWKLLIFLLLFLNFKLIIKIAALVLIYALRPGFKFGFKITNSRLPLFYIIIPAIGLLNWLLYGMVGNLNYTLILITGISFWVSCILAIHQVKLSIENNRPEVLHQTILFFFIINAIISLSVYAGIVWETGAINPYRYQGNYQKYFIGTGDYIKGLTFDTSTTNAVINGLGLIYFLFRGKKIPALMCMTVLLLTGSNFTNLLLCGALLYMFIFQTKKDQKSIIVVCFAMLITFLVKVSPQNNNYVTAACEKIFNIQKPVAKKAKKDIPLTEKPDSILTLAEKRQKFAQLYLDSINISLSKKVKVKPVMANMLITDVMARPVIPGDSIHTPSFQHRNDTSQAEKKLIQFIESNAGKLRISSRMLSSKKLPGKMVALQQTYHFFKQHPFILLTGTGIANFSSKLAFRATSMNVSGNYPARFAYINDDFKTNHLDLFLFYFTDKDDYHSVMNSPNSTYDQLLSEYGLAGLISFAVFYIAFFAKQIKKKSVAIPLLLFMLGAFFIEYWFEQLSVVVFFELLILLNIKETTGTINNAAT